MKKTFIVIVFSLLGCFTAQAQKGYLKLKNGEVIKGTLIEKTDDGKVIFEAQDGNEFEYEKSEVQAFKEFKDQRFNRKRGYIGLSFGPSIPIGDYYKTSGGDAEVGLNLSLVHFGYLFNDYLGICGLWYGGSHPTSTFDDQWIYGGMTVGPLISFAISPRFEIDLKPMIGYCVTSTPGSFSYWGDSYQSTSFAYSGSVMFRFHVGGRVSLTGEAGYFYTESSFEDVDYTQNIAVLNTNIGFAIRFGKGR